MPKNSCCVPFCKSGSVVSRRKNKVLGIRNPTMFKFPSICSNGDQKFANTENLTCHVDEKICTESNDITSKFVCVSCNRPFSCKRSLQYHVERKICKRSPNPSPNFMNPNCNMSSPDQYLEGLIKTEICSENESSTPAKFSCCVPIPKHSFHISYSFEMEDVCTLCNRTFTTKQNMHRHIGSQVCSRRPNLIPEFTCSKCNRMFVTKRSLEEHMEKQICSKLKIFICPNCNSPFTKSYSLERHVRGRICFKPTKVVNFRCSNCNNTFATKASLQRHVENKICTRPLLDKNLTSKVFICSNCHRKFATNQCLRRHIEKQICAERNAITSEFVCLRCNRSFACKRNLYVHLLTRMCEKILNRNTNFTCSNCNREFSSNQHLKQHVRKQICLRKAEPSPTNFTCSNCNRGFSMKHHLKTHVSNKICANKASPSTPNFVCSKCNCSFATYQSYEQHADSQICTRNPKPATPATNPELFEKWVKAVQRGDKKLTQKDKVCQLHFRDDLIKTHDRVVLSNGDVFLSERTKLVLAKEAIPTIFPNVPAKEKRGKRKRSARRNAVENENAFVKKRRLESIFGDSFRDAPKDTVPQKQQTGCEKASVNAIPENQQTTSKGASKEANQVKQQIFNKSSPIEFILDDCHAAEDTVRELKPAVNENRFILDDGQTDALGLQHSVDENPISGDSHDDATEDSVLPQLPVLKPNPVTDLSDDSITIEDNVLQVPHPGNLNSVTIWIKEEEEDCVDEFADCTAIEDLDDLFIKCSELEFPDTKWTCTMVENNILITYWSHSFDCVKKIIIDQNLKITAFIKDVGIMIDETEVHDLNAVKNVVKKLHGIKECAYNPAKSIRWKCRGFVKQHRKYCLPCISELEKDRTFQRKTD